MSAAGDSRQFDVDALFDVQALVNAIGDHALQVQDAETEGQRTDIAGSIRRLVRMASGQLGELADAFDRVELEWSRDRRAASAQAGFPAAAEHDGFDVVQRDLHYAQCVLRALIESEALASMDWPEGTIEAVRGLLEGVTPRLDALRPRIGGVA